MMKTATTRSRASGRATDESASQDENRDQSSSSSPGRTKWLIALVSLPLLAFVGLIFGGLLSGGQRNPSSASITPIPAEYDPDRAFKVLTQLCDIGPRPSGSPAMKRQQDLLIPIFKRLGGEVTMQTFDIRHPEDGSPVPMANLIASWHTDRPKRFLLCAHYDTRPYPDQDRHNRKGIFIGANDGASGWGRHRLV